MSRGRPRGRLAERLVLPLVEARLDADEDLRAWAHVLDSDGRRGLLVVTSQRGLAIWPDRAEVALEWTEVVRAGVESVTPGELLLAIEGVEERVAVRVSASSRGQRRRVAHLMRAVAVSVQVGMLDGAGSPTTADLPVRSRGIRGHLRRVAVTTAGSFLLVLGLLFASPFLPGPGILTILAGLAVLATEYDWAKDVHHWARERVARLRRRLQQRRGRRGVTSRAGRRTDAAPQGSRGR